MGTDLRCEFVRSNRGTRPGVRTLTAGVSSRGSRQVSEHQKLPGAIQANDCPRQANASGQTTSDHARDCLRTDPDNPEGQRGIYP
jgi:hypothetical protein